MLFEIDVAEIFKIELNFGAVIMPNYKSYEQVVGDKIFNAGLMVIGKEFLNDHTRQELIKIANQEPPKENTACEKWIGNQPILNYYFLDKMTHLPQKFNYLSEDINLETFLNKNIYHFIGKKKPWVLDVNERYDKYILNRIATNTNNIIFNKMIYKKIHEMFKFQIASLLEKGIDIKLLETPLN
jgi:lipopolysaccharide biosynthesis glycosyltransferase